MAGHGKLVHVRVQIPVFHPVLPSLKSRSLIARHIVAIAGKRAIRKSPAKASQLTHVNGEVPAAAGDRAPHCPAAAASAIVKGERHEPTKPPSATFADGGFVMMAFMDPASLLHFLLLPPPFAPSARKPSAGGLRHRPSLHIRAGSRRCPRWLPRRSCTRPRRRGR